MDNSTGDVRVDAVMSALNVLIVALSLGKPNDRSELDRVFAVAKTDAEKLYAYFSVFAIREIDTSEPLQR